MRHTDTIGTRWPATAEPTPSDSLATRAVGVSCRAVTEVSLAIELQKGLMSSVNQGSQMMDMHTCIHTHTHTHTHIPAHTQVKAVAEALELTGGVRGVSGGAGVVILFDLASEALQSRRWAHAPGFGGSGQGDGASDEPSVVLSSFPPPPPLCVCVCM